MVILDFSSGNTCQNKKSIVRDMVDAVKGMDVVIKWQLFESAPPNIPLDREIFEYAYDYADKKGLQTTASVFDLDSLHYLQTFGVPFIKIANRPDLYKLARGVDTPLMVSYPSVESMSRRKNITPLCCVSKYPAKIREYERNFTPSTLSRGISDHTVGLGLYKKYKPQVYEKHFVLEHSADNPDAGPFAITPEELSEL